MRRIVLMLIPIFLVGTVEISAQATATVTPLPVFTPAPAPLSYEDRKKKLELDRLELENEKLRLEMEKLKTQATKTVGTDKSDDKKEAALFRRQLSEKAEALAKDNRDKDRLLILDLVNGECWNKGVRYSVHDIYSMAEDQKIDVKKYLDKRDMSGDDRNRYVIENISLLRYNNRPRGVIDIKSPVKDGDFQVLTLEGISLDSNIGDVRNAYQNVHFIYTGEGRRGKLKLLKYKHSRDFLSFSDKLEFGFDKEGKLSEIWYGVLDEN